MKTLQECFDISFEGLALQGRPSFNYGGSCAYRGADGTKCAVGFLIKDDELARKLDSYGVHGESICANEAFKRLPEEMKRIFGNSGDVVLLLDAMQNAHDTWDEVANDTYSIS